MNYAETISQLEKQLQEIGEDPENLTYVFRELKGWTLLDFILHQNKELTNQDQDLLETIMAQLKNIAHRNTSLEKLIFVIWSLQLTSAF